MCGRYAITTSPAAMRALLDYPEQPNFPLRYNIAPTQPVPVVRIERGARQFALMRWGFISAQDAVEEADAEATPESRDTNPETETELHETDKPEATRIICD